MVMAHRCMRCGGMAGCTGCPRCDSMRGGHDMLGRVLEWDADDPSTEDSSSSVVQSAPDGSTEGPNK